MDDDLYAALVYAADDSKTEQRMYVSGINCSKTRAYEEMSAVKQRFGTRGKVVAYHGYQSFREGEVTPEEAHEIGLRTARKMWGDRYQVVVTTHLNTGKLHNHFVINSTSFVDGKKYRNKIGDHFELRRVSDAICREYGKSVLENAPFYGGGKKRYWAEKNGQLTHRDMLRRDIDEAITHSWKESAFIYYLESLGYEIIRGMDYQHPSVKAPTWQRAIRIDSLGADYTGEAISKRLQSNLGRGLMWADFQPPSKKRKPLLYILNSRPDYQKFKEPDGYMVCFQIIIALFELITGRSQTEAKHHSPISPELRAVWRKIDRISEEVRFLDEHRIVDSHDFHSFENQLDDRIRELEQERQKLRNKLRRVKTPEEEQALKERCKEISAQIAPYRKDKKLCARIKQRQPALQGLIEQELQLELGVQRQKQKSYRKDHER